MVTSDQMKRLESEIISRITNPLSKVKPKLGDDGRVESATIICASAERTRSAARYLHVVR